MLPNTLIDKPPAWTAGDCPGAGSAPLTQAVVSRNIADYPFPGRCSADERQAVLDRVAGPLERAIPGHLHPLSDFDARDLRFLIERRLTSRDHAGAAAPKALYLSEDQTTSVMINGHDHLAIRVQLPGPRAVEAGRRAAAVEAALAESLDFAFSDRRGYLCAGLDRVGTGLKSGVMLHLPALTCLGELGVAAERAATLRARLRGVKAGATPEGDSTQGAARGGGRAGQAFQTDFDGTGAGSPQEALGDLYLLVNDATLGISEEEILFNVEHAVSAVLDLEADARRRLLESNALGVADRVGRALGVARNARLLPFPEAVAVLGALRLGVVADLLPGVAVDTLNELLIGAQGAHLELAQGGQTDIPALNEARADLFRAALGTP